MPDSFSSLLAEAPEGSQARLWLEGGQIAAAAVPVGPGSLPPAVRTTIDAVAPGGELLFQGREWGPRGEGFRVEKNYREGTAHVRSALIAPDGSVLERAHSVPIPEVPQHVLATALGKGTRIDEASIVSGPLREEYWSLVVHDRGGRTFVVEIDLDGRLRRTLRRVAARVDS